MNDVLLEDDLAAKAQLAVEAVMAELELAESPKPVRVIYLAPGEQIVWDSTEDCRGGQLTARLSALTPHRTGGTRPANFSPCTIDYWTATIEITLLRCAATVDNQGQAPSAATLTGDGLRGASDLGIILRALTKLEFIDNITQWTPQGPQGGQFGNAWFFTMKLDATPCE